MNPQASEVVIAAPVEHAFRVFTEQIHTWWPLRTHAVAPSDATTAVLEGRIGGRLFERTSSGEEHLWGTLVTWDPPRRVGYTWHPGRGEETAQEVELTFTSDGEGTRVDLRHWGWEKLGDRMEQTVANYDEGWETVIGRYVERANA
jgi:uncharacterized protein YndB with AHSA1/START domain